MLLKSPENESKPREEDDRITPLDVQPAAAEQHHPSICVQQIYRLCFQSKYLQQDSVKFTNNVLH